MFAVVDDPVQKVDKLCEAVAYFVLAEFDEATLYVLRPVGDDIVLDRHRMEGDVVDREQKLVDRDVVVELDLPLKFLIVQSNWEHTRRSEFLATENIQNIKIRGRLW